ncbi:MAG: phosphoglycerate kinase [Deltaproteobacteria bacterium CG11_big_fil_rev_8_21_14_0_20_45_16]|nr:MAG: phosphoglycerate kinase [Deltaproteobacteria bacterium CG11_big_fil_rev_8_21_14_0_20_45_16]
MRPLSMEELPWDKFPENRRRVFLRVDFNVPMKAGKILDDFRIRQSIPTIKNLIEKKCIIVIGAHMGRPQKKKDSERSSLSLLAVAQYLAEVLDREVLFSEDLVGSAVRKLIFDGRPGTVILLENLRFDSREESDDLGFAERLMEERDIYIDDAFGACHRAHSSIHAVAKLARYKAMGYLLKKEWDCLNKVLHHPENPQMAILGGAKLEDKIAVIEALMRTCKTICVGGRMGLAFLAARGQKLGASTLSKESIQLAKRLIGDAKKHGIEILVPIDGRVGQSLEGTEARVVKLDGSYEIAENEGVFDIGPETLAVWSKALDAAKTIVWNGPMGVFENPCFAEGTLRIVDFLVEHKDKIHSIVGGGETVAAVAQRGALDKLYHISTGGGAMLEFLEGRELPGIEVLKLREREIQEIQDGRMAS